MKNKILLFLVVIFFSGCESIARKEYKFILTVEENELGIIQNKEKDFEKIEAFNDSIAYFEAYTKFIIAEKMDNDRKELDINYKSKPVSYKLLNSDGKDISSISFIKGDSIKKEIKKSIYSMKNSYKEISKSEKAIKNIDSVTLKKLKNNFREKKDEYSADKTIWYTHKSAPSYVNMNGIYIYFSANNLRFVFQYHSDKWLFIENLQFLIDGVPYKYYPQNLKRDNDETGITEWFDDKVGYSNDEIIQALAIAKKAKVKLNGDKFFEEIVISKKQLESIQITLQYYKAFGYDL